MKTHNDEPLAFLDSVLNTEEFTLPCGRVCKIQEINGEDEDNLSRVENLEKATDVFNKYISCVLIELDGKPVTPKAILSLRQRSKYYIAVKSRILSYGNEITFDHTFQGEEEPIKFEEDLLLYTQDFSKPVELEFIQDPNNTEGVIKNSKFSKDRCQPYKDFATDNEWVEFSTTSGKHFRFKYLNGEGEKKLLELERGSMSINEKLKARFLQLKDQNGQWALVLGFKPFTGKEMAEIRGYVNQIDSEFELLSKVTNPKTKKTEIISLFSKVGSFFFPSGK